ncbi:transposase [Pandoraea horticolens]|uniref:Transposase n=1 Tax=Pandoraea horticolens TaxID=2508298 RepID=A0A5E4XSW8_9BURK|nr:transposase [Pandoraea horticolens]VVE39168.1 transposase [Pandoraea horticolens]
MPYQARLKTGEARKRPKPTYRVTNAHAYNRSLKRRGQLNLYCPSGDLRAPFINRQPYVPGVSGRTPAYTNAYIELIYTYYRLFGWGMRQITGFMQEYWRLRALDIDVPSFGQLSDRFATLSVTVQ